MPRPIRRRCLPAQDIEVAVIGANFVKGVLRAVPLVKYLLDHVLTILKPKSNRPFVGRSSGVAVHFQLHLFHSDAWALHPPPEQPVPLHSGWPPVIARLIKVHRGSQTVDSARMAKLSHPELRNFLSDSAFE